MRIPKDRISGKKKAIAAGIWLIGGSSLIAQAGVVLAPPPHVDNPPSQQESYAESSFGKPPAPVDLGAPTGYAARETQMLEVEDDGTGNRKPAGLEFTKDLSPKASEALKPVTPDASQPTSPLQAQAQTAVTRRGIQEVALIAGDLGYFPKTVFVTRDIPVRMFVTGASKNTLCIMMDSFSVRRQVKSNKIEEVTFTPATPGKYRFYCPVNGMEGTMVVKEFSTAQLGPPESQ